MRVRLPIVLGARLALPVSVAAVLFTLAAPPLARSSGSAPLAKAPRYTGTITVSARESSPGGGGRSAYAYDSTATLPFAFSGSGHLTQTRIVTAALTGHFQTTHGTSDYRLCKGPDESGALEGKIRYYLSPTVLARTVTFSFSDVGETMTPNWHTVCGLPQYQADGGRLLGYAIEAAAGGPGHTFTFAARGGKLTQTGTLGKIVGTNTLRTYTITVVLKRVG